MEKKDNLQQRQGKKKIIEEKKIMWPKKSNIMRKSNTDLICWSAAFFQFYSLLHFCVTNSAFLGMSLLKLLCSFSLIFRRKCLFIIDEKNLVFFSLCIQLDCFFVSFLFSMLDHWPNNVRIEQISRETNTFSQRNCGLKT